MDNRLAIILALLAIALIAGSIWKTRSGRAKLVRSGEMVDLGKLGATKGGKSVTSFGKRATLLQFSTEVCSVCVHTAGLYREFEKNTPGLKHIEVDITDRMDLAAHFSVMQTPTTLILDRTGRVRARIGGAPKPNVVIDEINKLEKK
ncbi:MAG: TlpA family protein disulfide reductase [Actinomycetota bacterium]